MFHSVSGYVILQQLPDRHIEYHALSRLFSLQPCPDETAAYQLESAVLGHPDSQRARACSRADFRSVDSDRTFFGRARDYLSSLLLLL